MHLLYICSITEISTVSVLNVATFSPSGLRTHWKTTTCKPDEKEMKLEREDEAVSSTTPMLVAPSSTSHLQPASSHMSAPQPPQMSMHHESSMKVRNSPLSVAVTTIAEARWFLLEFKGLVSVQGRTDAADVEQSPLLLRAAAALVASVAALHAPVLAFLRTFVVAVFLAVLQLGDESSRPVQLTQDSLETTRAELP